MERETERKRLEHPRTLAPSGRPCPVHSSSVLPLAPEAQTQPGPLPDYRSEDTGILILTPGPLRPPELTQAQGKEGRRGQREQTQGQDWVGHGSHGEGTVHLPQAGSGNEKPNRWCGAKSAGKAEKVAFPPAHTQTCPSGVCQGPRTQEGGPSPESSPTGPSTEPGLQGVAGCCCPAPRGHRPGPRRGSGQYRGRVRQQRTGPDPVGSVVCSPSSHRAGRGANVRWLTETGSRPSIGSSCGAGAGKSPLSVTLVLSRMSPAGAHPTGPSRPRTPGQTWGTLSMARARTRVQQGHRSPENTSYFWRSLGQREAATPRTAGPACLLRMPWG